MYLTVVVTLQGWGGGGFFPCYDTSPNELYLDPKLQ